MKRPWVIKAGGELLASESARAKVLADLGKVFKKNPVVFVHGGGPQIEAELIKNKVPAEFINGRRLTSDEAMLHVERILSGQLSKGVTGDLVKKGIPAVGLSGRDGGLMTVEPIPGLGRAGKPAKVHPRLLQTLLKNKFLAVLSSVGSDKNGRAMNVNADDFASAVACALKAEHLVYLTDIAGVQNKYKKRIPVLKTSEIDGYIEDKTITGGMIPKVQSARNALQKGVGEVDIIDGFRGLDLNSGTRILK
jgi:acetylglutamate kinase